MKKILVPLADHEGLSAAHTKIIEYAKTLGEPCVTITAGLREWNMWLRHGELGYDPVVGVVKKELYPKLPKGQVKEIQDLGITNIELRRPTYPSESTRKNLLAKAQAIVDMYSSQIQVERYRLLCLSAIMRLMTRERGPEFQGVNQDCVLVGPELPMFFLKHIGELLGWKERVIMPTMVKDPLLGIRAQFTLSRVSMEHIATVMGFRRIFLEAKPHIKINESNQELMSELNYSYPGLRVHDVGAWEGGMVNGRLSEMSFEIPTSDGGSIIVEDADYEIYSSDG